MKPKSPLFTDDLKVLMSIPDDKLPPLMTTRLVCARFGILQHYGAALVRAGLRPVAFPLSEADGYFWKDDVLAAARDKGFCTKLRREMKASWESDKG